MEDAGRLIAGEQRRQLPGKGRINRLQRGTGPLALADVEQGRAAGIAILHHFLTGEPEIEIVVGQEHGGQVGVILRLVLLEPKNFRGGVAGQHGVAQGADDLLEAAELLVHFLALGHGGGVAPQLGRADHFPLRVEGHEPVLLAADADGFDFATDGLGGAQPLADGAGRGIAPGVGMLLLRAGRQVCH